MSNSSGAAVATPVQTVALSAAAVVRRWRFILALTLLCALCAAVAVLAARVLTPRYSETVDLLLTGSKYQITFDPRFRTVDSLGIATASMAGKVDEFRLIAQSQPVKDRATELYQQSAVSTSSAEAPIGKVDVAVRGTAVVVTGSASNPEVAHLTARAYAQAIREQIINVYTQSGTDLALLQHQLQEATTRLEQAQQALEDFTKSNRIDELEREIKRRVELRDRLESVSNTQSGAVAQQLQAYYWALIDLDGLSRDARALREQILSAGNSTASSTAQAISLLSLESRLVNLGALGGAAASSGAPATSSGQASGTSGEAQPGVAVGSFPAEVRVNVVTPPGQNSERDVPTPFQPDIRVDASALVAGSRDSAALLADVDALLNAVDARRNDYLKAIDEAAAGLSSGDLGHVDARLTDTSRRLNEEIQDLQSQLSGQKFRQKLLEDGVASARSARDALVSKVQEAQIASATSAEGNIEILPRQDEAQLVFPMPMPMAVAVGAIAGLLIACLFVIAADIWSRFRWGATISSLAATEYSARVG